MLDSKQGQMNALALFKAVDEFRYPICSEITYFALVSLLHLHKKQRSSGMLLFSVLTLTMTTNVCGPISYIDVLRLLVGHIFNNTRQKVMVVKRGWLLASFMEEYWRIRG